MCLRIFYDHAPDLENNFPEFFEKNTIVRQRKEQRPGEFYIGKSFSLIIDFVQLNNIKGKNNFFVVIFLQKYVINEKMCSIILHIQWRNM